MKSGLEQERLGQRLEPAWMWPGSVRQALAVPGDSIIDLNRDQASRFGSRISPSGRDPGPSIDVRSLSAQPRTPLPVTRVLPDAGFFFYMGQLDELDWNGQ